MKLYNSPSNITSFYLVMAVKQVVCGLWLGKLKIEPCVVEIRYKFIRKSVRVSDAEVLYLFHGKKKYHIHTYVIFMFLNYTFYEIISLNQCKKCTRGDIVFLQNCLVILWSVKSNLVSLAVCCLVFSKHGVYYLGHMLYSACYSRVCYRKHSLLKWL